MLEPVLNPMKIAVLGAGWAGMAASVAATQAGHSVVVFEASRTLGGRARALNPQTLPNGRPVTLDNGQHILIGAYSQTLRLMRQVGVEPASAFLQQPMTLLFPDGLGLRFGHGPAPLDALAGILSARGWTWADKASLLRASIAWRLAGFKCETHTTVAQLCQGLRPRVLNELITPLCVSALNTPPERASAQVFLRILQDALFGVTGGSRLLLPRLDLSELFPHAAAHWLVSQGGEVRLGARIDTLQQQGAQWQVENNNFDAVIVATASTEAVRLLNNSLRNAPETLAKTIRHWIHIAQGLTFEAITTVYAWAPDARLPHPMLTLRCDEAGAPAQFVFDRGQLGGPPGLLAFVVSASLGERLDLQAQVLTQARAQLGLLLQAVQTIVEKRATFACTPGLLRPAQEIAPGLLVCGDYVVGPYPATLEGAVRSALLAVQALPTAN
jgi:squalene-associated FAD-dependent desaturase